MGRLLGLISILALPILLQAQPAALGQTLSPDPPKETLIAKYGRLRAHAMKAWDQGQYEAARGAAAEALSVFPEDDDLAVVYFDSANRIGGQADFDDALNQAVLRFPYSFGLNVVCLDRDLQQGEARREAAENRYRFLRLCLSAAPEYLKSRNPSVRALAALPRIPPPPGMAGAENLADGRSEEKYTLTRWNPNQRGNRLELSTVTAQVAWFVDAQVSPVASGFRAIFRSQFADSNGSPVNSECEGRMDAASRLLDLTCRFREELGLGTERRMVRVQALRLSWVSGAYVWENVRLNHVDGLIQQNGSLEAPGPLPWTLEGDLFDTFMSPGALSVSPALWQAGPSRPVLFLHMEKGAVTAEVSEIIVTRYPTSEAPKLPTQEESIKDWLRAGSFLIGRYGPGLPDAAIHPSGIGWHVLPRKAGLGPAAPGHTDPFPERYVKPWTPRPPGSR